MYRWFVVAEYVQWTYEGFEGVRRPTSTPHAKEMGTSRTACGLQCGTWEKLWHERFDAMSPKSCKACVQRVAGATGTARPATSKLDG